MGVLLILLTIVLMLLISHQVGHSLEVDEIAQFSIRPSIRVRHGRYYKSEATMGYVKVSVNASTILIESNGIPDHGTRPIATHGRYKYDVSDDDDDYRMYVTDTSPELSSKNGNRERKRKNRGKLTFLKERPLKFDVPAVPELVEISNCLPMGPIAIARNGVLIYNPLTSERTKTFRGKNKKNNFVSMHDADDDDDEEENEDNIYDECNGYVTPDGLYHYAQNPICVTTGEKDEFVGVALDGFPLYGPLDVHGNEIRSEELDECHGRFVNGRYRYHLTLDFPYVFGCFRGVPSPSAWNGKCSYVLRSDSIIIADNGGGYGDDGDDDDDTYPGVVYNNPETPRRMGGPRSLVAKLDTYDEQRHNGAIKTELKSISFILFVLFITAFVC